MSKLHIKPASNHAQMSEEWFAVKLGKISASRINDVMATTAKGLPTSKYMDYAYSLAAERMTGNRQEIFTTLDMQRGIDMEPLAKEYYAEFYGVTLTDAPFIFHRDMTFAGCSLDAIANNEYLVEFKNPKTTTFLKVKYENEPPENYFHQCMWQMACTGAERCDLVYYDDRIADPTKQMFRFVIERDNELIAKMEQEVIKFNDLIEQIINKE